MHVMGINLSSGRRSEATVYSIRDSMVHASGFDFIGTNNIRGPVQADNKLQL